MRRGAFALVVAVMASMLVPAGAGAAESACVGVPPTPPSAPNGYIVGTTGNDVLVGTAGDDIFEGHGGNDIYCGGAGRDTIYYWWAPTGQITSPGGGRHGGFVVEVDLVTKRAFRANHTDELYSIEVVYGSDGPDRLEGDAEHNHLDGRSGDDEIRGHGGNDKLDGGAGNDKLWGGDGNDSISGHGGDDFLYGEGDNDRLEGEDGADTIRGGPGFDWLDYRCTANNTFCSTTLPAMNPVARGQTVDLREGTSHGGQGIDSLPDGDIEGVRGTSGNDKFDGRDNVWVQGAENYGDYFWPAGGNDIIDGRQGVDYVDFHIIEDDPDSNCATPPPAGRSGVTVNLVTGLATGGQGENTISNVNHIIGSAHDDVIIGNANANDLWGSCGDDEIRGGGGKDRLFGDEGHDQIFGDAGDDAIDGGPGDDALAGGADSDLLSYDSYVPPAGSRAGVRVQLAGGTATGDGSDSLSGFEIVVGSPYNDVLVGSAGRDLLFGGAGADELWGRGGPDVLFGHGLRNTGQADGKDKLYGGPGIDTADYTGAASKIDVDLATLKAAADGNSSQDELHGIESVRGSAFADVIRGDAATNYLFGGPGNDTLLGRGGDDYLDGQGGKDTIDGGAGARDTIDYSNAGAGRLNANLATGAVTLGTVTDTVTRIESVIGTASADTIVGNGGANYLAGGGGNDTLKGAAGADFLFGGAGSDKLVGGVGTDTCHQGPTFTSCEKTSTARPSWYSTVAGWQTFRDSGDDAVAKTVAEAIEELRRLHRRRLHR